MSGLGGLFIQQSDNRLLSIVFVQSKATESTGELSAELTGESSVELSAELNRQ